MKIKDFLIKNADSSHIATVGIGNNGDFLFIEGLLDGCSYEGEIGLCNSVCVEFLDKNSEEYEGAIETICLADTDLDTIIKEVEGYLRDLEEREN